MPIVHASRPRPLVLLLLDGFGQRDDAARNATQRAQTPNVTGLRQRFPHTLLRASGAVVGLPEGQGASCALGHLAISAGRALARARTEDPLPALFPEQVSGAGLAQLRCAEREKFGCVTRDFNGGREAPYEGEERQQAEGLDALVRVVVSAIESGRYDFVLVNIGDPDLAAHSGSLTRTMEAIEAADRAVGAIATAVLAKRGALLLTADHGHAEQLGDEGSQSACEKHRANPVPLLYVQAGYEVGKSSLSEQGSLADLAPTMLHLLGLEQPAEMTGRCLLPG